LCKFHCQRGNFEDENFKVLFITGRDKIDPESGKDTFPIISESGIILFLTIIFPKLEFQHFLNHG